MMGSVSTAGSAGVRMSSGRSWRGVDVGRCRVSSLFDTVFWQKKVGVPLVVLTIDNGKF
jgi:hypothetical protein